MIDFIIRILGNAAALYVAQYFIAGFSVTGDIKQYILAGILLGLLNLIVRPILKLITFPLLIVTLGLFSLVINAILLWIVDYVFAFVSISDIRSLIWATIVVGIVNLIISGITKKRDK